MQAHEQQLERLKQALNVNSDTAFSQILGVSQGSISGAKKRKQIPFAWFFQVAEKTNTSIDWLFSGHAPTQDDKEQILEMPPQPACTQLHEIDEQISRQQYEKLEKELAEEREERRDLARENRQLWKENAALREELATLKERANAPATLGFHGDASSVA